MSRSRRRRFRWRDHRRARRNRVVRHFVMAGPAIRAAVLLPDRQARPRGGTTASGQFCGTDRSAADSFCRRNRVDSRDVPELRAGAAMTPLRLFGPIARLDDQQRRDRRSTIFSENQAVDFWPDKSLRKMCFIRSVTESRGRRRIAANSLFDQSPVLAQYLPCSAPDQGNNSPCSFRTISWRIV
jgi:hypothetical protein